MGDYSGGRLPDKHIYLMLAIFFSIFVPFIFLVDFIIRSLGFSPEMGFIPFMRIIMSLFYLVMFVPSSILIEFFLSRWKNRKFRMGGFLVSCGIFAEAILVMLIVSFAFDLAFPGLNFNHEPFPGLTGLALGLMIAFPLISIGVTGKIPKVQKYTMRELK